MKTNEAIKAVYELAKKHAPVPDGCDEINDMAAAYIQEALATVGEFIAQKEATRKSKIKEH